MSNALTSICDYKREYVSACKIRSPLDEINSQINEQTLPRAFEKSLRNAEQIGYGLIAEIKKASPSAGLIRNDFDPQLIAQEYSRGGATCLSVLTDVAYFQGSDLHLKMAKEACNLPVLRKDFIIDSYQVAEARAIGADCILLILAILDDTVAHDLEDYASSLGMDVLIEVHNEAEVERALDLKSPLIGINNRNLKTLKTDLNTTTKLAPLIPSDRTLICESGLKSSCHLSKMAKLGVRNFLIGESLMSQSNIINGVRALIQNPIPFGKRNP